MYILAATFKDVENVKYFVARTRASLESYIDGSTDYRLWRDGWIESKDGDSWRVIGTHVAGVSAQVVL